VFQRFGASFAVLSLSIFVASSASATLTYSNLYVLGDSLVDAGNTQALVLALTGGATDVTPAGSGYFSGRFTNGITFADMVNQAVRGRTRSAPAPAAKFSYGGAGAQRWGSGARSVPDELSRRPSARRPGALYLINVGATTRATSCWAASPAWRARP
jgi:outer membrane lipase/esterase